MVVTGLISTAYGGVTAVGAGFLEKIQQVGRLRVFWSVI